MTITITRTRAIIVALVVAVVAVATFLLWPASGQDQAETKVPYDDPRSAGEITLCSTDGKAVTEGDTADTPFADLALGETGVPSGDDPAGAVATLFAYQPRQGVGPEEFSGSPLSAASTLADPERPAALVTSDAWSLADFVEAFPADWDGFVQLRLYLGTAAAGTLSDQPYDTADLRVDGDHWELVRGGDASCDDAESLVH